LTTPAEELSAGTVLHLAPGLRTRTDTAGHVLVDTPVGTVVDAGPAGFAILAMFSRPRTLGDAVAELEDRHRGTVDFMPTATVIMALIETGVLATSEAGPVTGWADPVEHARMLHDEGRTGSFIAAIEATVRPEDVVLDIGTGSGVLAVAAARAGARRVYAVEPSDIAQVAERVFAVNAVQDRVTLVPGWSTQIELPERADVLVSEMIGSEPMEEDILETTLDARRRLLVPDARLIPSALHLYARPVRVPRSGRRQRAIDPEAIESWRRRYGIDLEPLLDAARKGPVHWPTQAEEVATWTVVGPPIELASWTLRSFESPEVRASADLVVERPGSVDAVVVTFRADLHADVQLTFDPWTWAPSSWSTSVWLLPEPVEAEPGALLRANYRRRTPGVPDGLTFEVVDPES